MTSIPMQGSIVVATARLWLGTPYVHQASCRGAGADCLGLVRGVWRDVVGREPQAPPPYSRDWSEANGTEVLMQAADRWLERKAGEIEPGDVMLFRMRDGSVAKHLGIVSKTGPDLRFIHAYSGHGVVESPLSPPWARRVVALYRFPEGDAAWPR